jgi:molecular chaperone DnaJ
MGKIITSVCKECRGQGQVPRERRLQIRIPPGVDTGSQLRIAGEGEAGAHGGPTGDLYVVVRVEEHALFQRDGDNLLCELPISFTQAALGGVIDVPTLEGGSAKVTVPEGTQGGTSFRVRGHGVPHLGSRGKGDLVVTVRVVTPGRLTAEQRKLLEQLARTLPHLEVRPKDRSFVEKVKDILS